MATTTANNGWQIPVATDYVKDGYAAIDTLGNAIDASVGTGLLAWQTWAPTLSGGWLNGNGLWTARYVQIGKIVHFYAQFNLNTTTTVGTNLRFSLPVQPKNGYNIWNTNCYFYVANATYYIGALRPYFVTNWTVEAYAQNSSTTYTTTTAVTSLIPGTWNKSTDLFIVSGTYEAA